MQDRNVEMWRIFVKTKKHVTAYSTAQVKHILSIQNHGCWAGIGRFRTFASGLGVILVQYDYSLPHDTGDENVLRVV